jgi:hypothetical protein
LGWRLLGCWRLSRRLLRWRLPLGRLLRTLRLVLARDQVFEEIASFVDNGWILGLRQLNSPPDRKGNRRCD